MCKLDAHLQQLYFCHQHFTTMVSKISKKGEVKSGSGGGDK